MSSAPPIPILVVEDEESIRTGLCDVLAYHGYAPEGVERGDDGLARATQGSFALVILDVMLPGVDGFEICERLRGARPDQPILMLTARGAEQDVLEGFRRGSDDYVTKPFSLAQLMARVEALLRRSGALEDKQESQDRFEFGPWIVDPRQLELIRGDAAHDATPGATPDATRQDLSRRDVQLLALFAAERGHIVSRRRLLRDLWGYPNPDRVETRSVDMHIAKLRKKLGPDAGALIETVRGQGYRFQGCGR